MIRRSGVHDQFGVPDFNGPKGTSQGISSLAIAVGDY